MNNKISIFLIFLFCLSTTLIFGQTDISTPKYSKVLIAVNSPDDIVRLQQLGFDVQCGAEQNYSESTVELVLSEYEMIVLEKNRNELKYKVLDDDVSATIAKRLAEDLPKAIKELEYLKKTKTNKNIGQQTGCLEGNYPVPNNFELGSMGGFTTYSEVLSELD